jgi:hypothetical protein
VPLTIQSKSIDMKMKKINLLHIHGNCFFVVGLYDLWNYLQFTEHKDKAQKDIVCIKNLWAPKGARKRSRKCIDDDFPVDKI